MIMLWSYINFDADVNSVDQIPVMLSQDYLGENVNGFRCTGSFYYKPTKDDLAAHIRSYAIKYLRKNL